MVFKEVQEFDRIYTDKEDLKYYNRDLFIYYTNNKENEEDIKATLQNIKYTDNKYKNIDVIDSIKI